MESFQTVPKCSPLIPVINIHRNFRAPRTWCQNCHCSIESQLLMTWLVTFQLNNYLTSFRLFNTKNPEQPWQMPRGSGSYFWWTLWKTWKWRDIWRTFCHLLEKFWGFVYWTLSVPRYDNKYECELKTLRNNKSTWKFPTSSYRSG